MSDAFRIHGVPQPPNSGYIYSEYDFEVIKRSTRTFSPGWRGLKERVWRKKVLYQKVPVLSWLPKYSREDAFGDLIAGLTVGLMIITQSLAYAGVSGLDPKYGLYSAFLGCFVYVILGSSKYVPFGPTATTALMVFQAAGGNWERSVLLTFLGGIIEVTAGVFRLGFVLDFVSGPVGSGFISAIALTVIASQSKFVFGIPAKGNTFLEMAISMARTIDQTRLGDLILGVVCIVFLVSMRQISRLKFPPGTSKLLSKTVWYLCISRNAIIVVVTALIAYFWHSEDEDDWFILSGDIPKGLPPFIVPPFSVPEIRNGEGQVVQEYQSFWEMIQYLGLGVLVVPLIGLLENMSICKAYSKDMPVDASQELIALGSANFFTTFVGGFRGNGGLGRAAVMSASGVRTQFANFYTGILVLLSMLFLTPYFYYIPKATLGAMVISAVSFAIEYHVVAPIWRAKKSELFPCLVTFLACLVLRIDLGILVGIAVNVCFILYHAARPKLYLERRATDLSKKYVLITPDRCLMFPSCDYFRTLINKRAIVDLLPVVIDCTNIYGADFTAANTLDELLKLFRGRNQELLFLNMRPDVAAVLKGARVPFLGFYTYEDLEDYIDSKGEKRTSL